MSEEIRSIILGADGARATTEEWEAPSGSSPYFGWMGENGGYTTIRISSIDGMCLGTQRNDQYVIHLESNCNFVINIDEAKRLMRRLGWVCKSKVRAVTQ